MKGDGATITQQQRAAKLPALLERKLYKTGQTRGADDDVVFQNRVGRNSTVLIPFSMFGKCRTPAGMGMGYENGFIVLITPGDYFGNPGIEAALASSGLTLGKNLLVFYETRSDWQQYNPEQLRWKPAASRRSPLRGQYVARIAGTTAAAGTRINRGFCETSLKGAGIRVYEYADSSTIKQCRLQLEAVFWQCSDSLEAVIRFGMPAAAAQSRRELTLASAEKTGLLDWNRLKQARLLNAKGIAVCPLCLEELSAGDFFSRLEQAEGRAVHDLTVTAVSLFHIEELRPGEINHRPYNLGWGHHHCNVVVKDAGIRKTLEWMERILRTNAL